MTNAGKWISSLAVATAVSLTSFSSSAADLFGQDPPTKTVKAWDLDLANPTDVQTLYHRVQNAASDLCQAEARREWKQTKRRAPVGWTEQCAIDAVDRTVHAIAHPQLDAVHTQERLARND